RDIAALLAEDDRKLDLVLVAAFGEADRHALGRADQRRVRLEEKPGRADGRRRLSVLRRRACSHLFDMRLVIGGRRHELGGPRHRRDAADRRNRLARRLRRHPLEPRAPRRQGRDHRIALHRVGGGRPDLGLRLGDVVHHLAAHYTQAVVVVPAQPHDISPRWAPARLARSVEARSYFGLKMSLNSPCHFFCSSPAKIVAMIFLSFNLSLTYAGLTGTSWRVGMRPRLVRNCSASRLSMKFAPSKAALGCGACELTPTEPKNSATGSSAQKSMAAPDNCTLTVSDA